MVALAYAWRELPLPRKYIVQLPKVDLLFVLNALTSPTPVKVAATTVVCGVPDGSHELALHT